MTNLVRSGWHFFAGLVVLVGCSGDDEAVAGDSSEAIESMTRGVQTPPTANEAASSIGAPQESGPAGADGMPAPAGPGGDSPGPANGGTQDMMTGMAAAIPEQAAGAIGGTEPGGGPGVVTDDAPDAGAVGGDSPVEPLDPSAIPVLPEITGDCPEFATGDFSFGGVSGVMDVGPISEGGAPLLFYWAGTSFSASTYTLIGDKNIEKITSEGGVIVSIQGMSGQDEECSITGYYSADFDPPSQIAACAVQNHGIDPRRIYAAGCSAGGVTAGCMATRLSSFIAAVATNSGGLTRVEDVVDPEHVPAVMTMHGGAADFGGLFVRQSANLDNAIKNAGGFAVNCDHGGGHCAASSELYDAAFEFLFAHPFGVDPKPYASNLPASFPDYCEIF